MLQPTAERDRAGVAVAGAAILVGDVPHDQGRMLRVALGDVAELQSRRNASFKRRS